MVKYPHITSQLSGQDGNAFNLLGIVRHDLKRGGVPKEEIDQFLEEAMSGTYDDLLVTCMKWVNVQ